MLKLLACSRLYNATPRCAQAWRDIFHEVSNLSGISLYVEDWAAPAPLDELWARPDMGLVFQCGRPYVQAGARHRIIGAPLTGESKEQGKKAVYRSLLLARASSGWKRIEDSFGHRLGHMAAHSQSGYNAPRFLLAPYARGSALYSESVELATPLDCIRALQESRVDVIPLDSYYHSLLCVEYQNLKEELTILAVSPWTPMPVLTSAPDIDPGAARALRCALEEWNNNAAHDNLPEALCLRGFAFPSPSDYAVLAEQEATALRLAYPCLA